MVDGDRTVYAAGAVVSRDLGSGPEVLVVHRPRYDDWSLPKGKLEPGESLPATAVREVAEETGVQITLGAPLSLVRYAQRGMTKEVSYWVGHGVEATSIEPTEEIDEAAWVPVHELSARLSYEGDLATVQEALTMPATTTLVVVRHGAAVKRAVWPAGDRSRPLSPQGRGEAVRLESLLAPWAISRIVTSPALRCVDTVQPFAARHGMAVGVAEELSEEIGETDPAAVVGHLRAVLAAGAGTIICTHRPLLAPIGDEVGIEFTPEDRREALPPAGIWVVHLRTDVLVGCPHGALRSAVVGVQSYRS